MSVPLSPVGLFSLSSSAIMALMLTLLLVFIGGLVVFAFISLRALIWIFNKYQSLTGGEPLTEPKTTRIRFRIKYVALPLAVMLLAVVMVVWLYGRLPDAPALNFDNAGVGSDPTTRAGLALWALLPQVLLTLLSFTVVWGVTRIGNLGLMVSDAGMKLSTLLVIMGNMVAVPQLVLGLAVLNIFGYNVFETRLVPLVPVVLLIGAVGAVVLGVFFVRVIARALNVGK